MASVLGNSGGGNVWRVRIIRTKSASWVTQQENEHANLHESVIASELLTFTNQWLIKLNPNKFNYAVVRNRLKYMKSTDNLTKFANLSFDDFRELAKDPSLSRHQKVGFPDSYRSGKEEFIFRDIVAKIPQLELTDKIVLEIGPGCSELPIMLAELCKNNSNRLIFVDSEEMLSHLPNEPHISKRPGAFPEAIEMDADELRGKVNVIIAYSVIQYAYSGGNVFGFLDKCLSLLAAGGEIIYGDIPNITMRKRFFSSDAGVRSHREYTGSDEAPEVIFNQLEIGQIDDSIVLAILARARAQGFHAWVVPQLATLPMANRREDILIRKP